MTESNSIYILIATDPGLWQNSIYAVSHDKDRLIDIAQDLINNYKGSSSTNFIDQAHTVASHTLHGNIITGLEIVEEPTETKYDNPNTLGDDGLVLVLDPSTNDLFIDYTY